MKPPRRRLAAAWVGILALAAPTPALATGSPPALPPVDEVRAAEPTPEDSAEVPESAPDAAPGDEADPAAPEEPSAEDGGEGTEPDGAPDEGSADASREPADPTRDDVFKDRVREAIKQYDYGLALMRQAKYAEAAAAFERSYASAEFGNTLFSIVTAYDAASSPVAALGAARRFMALPECEGAEGPANRPCGELDARFSIERDVRRLEALIGELDLDVQQGVILREIRVNGRVRAQRDFPLILLPGSYVVELVGPNKGDYREHPLEIEAGKASILTVLPFVRELDTGGGDGGEDGGDDGGADGGGRDRLIDPERRARFLKGFFWTSASLTAVSAVTLGVVGGLTLRERRLFKEEKCAAVCDEEMAEDHPYPHDRRDRFNQLLPVTNAMIGVTAALGVTTIVLGVFAFSKPRKRGEQARVTASPYGIAVHW